MRDQLQIVTAIVRRADDLLMVLQAGPDEKPGWTVPGGRVEPGEFVTDALVREVKEETGLTVLDLGRLAFTAQVDKRRDGWFATVWDRARAQEHPRKFRVNVLPRRCADPTSGIGSACAKREFSGLQAVASISEAEDAPTAGGQSNR
ncbi:MAG TPA: NUDIX hydrolase [Gaiellaceae bacterium]